MDTEKFAAFISERRRELGLTQDELAKKLNVTDKAVSRWENGHGFPDVNTLEPLADALGISIVELMKSEMIAEGAISPETADAALSDTIEMAGVQKKRSRAMIALAVVLTAVLVVALAFFGWQIWAYNNPIINIGLGHPVGSWTLTPEGQATFDAVRENHDAALDEHSDSLDNWVSIGPVIYMNYYSLPIVSFAERSVFGMSKTWRLRIMKITLYGERYFNQIALRFDEVPYLFLTHIDVVDGETWLTSVGYYTEDGVTKPYYDVWTIDYAFEEIKNLEDWYFDEIWERFPELKEACDQKLTAEEWNNLQNERS